MDPPSFWANSVAGLTLGVEPLPTDLSTVSLLSRLRDLADRTCSDLAWITSPSVCSSLTAKLQQASQAASQGDSLGARAPLQNFATELQSQHNSTGTLPVTHNAYWLLKVNAEFILGRLPPGGTAHALYLTGSGGTANPPTLALSATAPSGSTAKYKDSPSVNFNNRNPWADVGTWTGPPGLVTGTLSALGETHVWLGLKNSDDIGTNFDIRVETFRNGVLISAAETKCVQGLTRNAAQAREVTVPPPTFPATSFSSSDVLRLRVRTRIGTNAAGGLCGGHSNAVGVRLYFDAVSRLAQVSATF